MNIHIPERLPGETFDEYRARRIKSRAAVDKMTLKGVGEQRRAPGSREQLRQSTRRRLRSDGQERAKRDRSRQRWAVSRARALRMSVAAAYAYAVICSRA